MVETIENRFKQIMHVIDLFNSDLSEDLVELEIEDSKHYVNFNYFPISETMCPLSITIDKVAPNFLTVEIGKKIVYEECEGLRLPDATYLKELINSVAGGKVLEKETFFFGRCVKYIGSVELDGYADIFIEKKSLPKLLMPDVEEKKYFYEPWR